MNETVEQAYEIQEEFYERYLPDLEIGEICEINDLWDGNGEIPEDSYSIQVTNQDWINYSFDLLEEKENPLDSLIKITKIELI